MCQLARANEVVPFKTYLVDLWIQWENALYGKQLLKTRSVWINVTSITATPTSNNTMIYTRPLLFYGLQSVCKIKNTKAHIFHIARLYFTHSAYGHTDHKVLEFTGQTTTTIILMSHSNKITICAAGRASWTWVCNTTLLTLCKHRMNTHENSMP